jgi:ABC-2 type transport system permease protein
VFICLTLFVLLKQRQKKLNGRDAKFCGTILVALILLGILSNLVFTRFDFTKEKRFTISAVSRNIMDSLKAPVKIAVYLQGDNFPGGMKRLQRGIC